MQNRRLWGSLCVSAVLLMALLTGVYSIMIEPTVTNVVTAKRTTYGYTSAEETDVYVWGKTEAIIVGAVTTRFTVSSYGECGLGYVYYDSIELYDTLHDITRTYRRICILWENGVPFVEDLYVPATSYYNKTNTMFSYSFRTLTLTSTTTMLGLSFVQFTVTETHYENVPNPQKSYLQVFTFALLIIGVVGIALAMPRSRTSASGRS